MKIIRPAQLPPLEKFIVISRKAKDGACFVELGDERVGIVGSRSNEKSAIGLAENAGFPAMVIDQRGAVVWPQYKGLIAAWKKQQAASAKKFAALANALKRNAKKKTKRK